MTRRAFIAAGIACVFILGASAQQKIVIAHRGASAYVPEHTLEAYAMAHAMGADYIEPDLVLTKDKVFVCMHDKRLEATTDVEQRFPDRKRADGKWYAADFTLDEIKQLRVHERLGNRFPQGKSKFEVPTFAEMIELMQGLNKTTGREAGIYPELKDPKWHREQGLPMEEALLAILAQYGYTGKDAKVFVQCFEPESLQRMRNELHSELPQIQLLGTVKESGDMLTAAGMANVAKYANGIGPAKEAIVANPEIVKWAHDNKLLVHPYTLRADALPSKYENFDQELAQFYNIYGVDGVFTDFCDKAAAFLKRK